MLWRRMALLLLRLRPLAVLWAEAASPPPPDRRALPADAAPQAAWRLSARSLEARQLPPSTWRPLAWQAVILAWQSWVLAQAQSPSSSQAGALLRAPSLSNRTLRLQRAAPQRRLSHSEHCLLPSLLTSLERHCVGSLCNRAAASYVTHKGPPAGSSLWGVCTVSLRSWRAAHSMDGLSGQLPSSAYPHKQTRNDSSSRPAGAVAAGCAAPGLSQYKSDIHAVTDRHNGS